VSANVSDYKIASASRMTLNFIPGSPSLSNMIPFSHFRKSPLHAVFNKPAKTFSSDKNTFSNQPQRFREAVFFHVILFPADQAS